MKIKLLILSIIALFILTGLASADVTETNNGFYGTISNNGSLIKTLTQVNDFHAIGFVCASDDCSNINGTLWNGQVQNSGSDNQMILKYPAELMQKGYGVFFYKEGFFPFEAKIDYFGAWSTTADNYLTRKENCQIPINDLMITNYGNKVVVNVTLSSDVSSPVQHAGPLNYVPDSIKNLYAVDAKVKFSFVGPDNVSITEDINLPASEHKRVSVYQENLKAGQYQLIVESNSNDVKCLHSIPLTVYSNLLIQDNKTNVTLPTIAILSPEAKTYNNKTILMNLRSTNATSVFYNWNGVNITYSAPAYVNFNEGRNTLTAYAVNNVTIAHISVTFNVDTSVNNTNQTDTTPPASVTNLTLASRTKSSLSWTWNNPSDSDFNQAIVNINGVNVANITGNTYTASGLQKDSLFTITIHTKDFSGNVNSVDISNSARTLDDSNNGGGGNDKKKTLYAITPVENDIAPEIFNEEESIILNAEQKKGFNWIILARILLFAGSIVLLILLLVLAGRRK